MRGLLAASACVAAALAAGCFQPPSPDCAFACEPNGTALCPEGYSCRPDGLCKRAGVPDDQTCPDVTNDAARIDASIVDGAVNDAPMFDAAIDATVDAPTDAAIDAFAGLRITTTSPLDFGTVATAMRTVMITNDGASMTTAINVTLTGSADFTLVVAGDTCSGQLVAGGGNCRFDILFTASSAGPRTGTATVMATTGGMASITLQATGL